MGEQKKRVKDWLRGRDLNPRPSGYEPDELPGCSTPRSKDGQYTLFPRRGKPFPQKLSRKISKECPAITVNVPNTKSDEAAQAHSNQFPRRTELDCACAKGPATAFAPQSALARSQPRFRATKPVPTGGVGVHLSPPGRMHFAMKVLH